MNPYTLLRVIQSSLLGLMLMTLLPTSAMAESTADQMGDSIPLQNWQLVLGFLLPLVVSVLTKQEWSSSIKAVAAFVISMVATLGTMILTGDLSGDFDVSTKMLQVFALTIPFYYGFWKPIGATEAIHDRTG